MTSLFFEGILLGLLVAVSLGPAFFAIIQTGINKGFKHGIFMAIGISLSDILLVSISYLIGAQLFDDPQNKVYVGLIGGIILIIFGSVSWAKKPDILKRRNIKYTTPTDKPLYYYSIRGFFLNIANPFLFFFWFGALGYVGNHAPEGEMLQSTLIFFSGTFITIFATDILKSYVGGKIKGFLRPRKELFLNKTVGLALVIFGVVLIYRTMDDIGFFERVKGDLLIGKKVEAQYNVHSPENNLILTLYKDSSFLIRSERDGKQNRFSGTWTYMDTSSRIFRLNISESTVDTMRLPRIRYYQLTVTGLVPWSDSTAYKVYPSQFNQQEDFTIVSISRNKMDIPGTDSLSNLCEHWTLTPLQIKKVVNEAEKIDYRSWHYQFDVLPCALNARIKQNNKVFRLEINAGSWFTVSAGDSSIYYGNYNIENSGLFLSKALTEEE